MFGMMLLKIFNTAPLVTSSAIISIIVSSPAIVPIISGKSQLSMWYANVPA